MFAFPGFGFLAPFFKEFRCPHCGSREGYVSSPHNFVESSILPVFRLRPARCGDCYERSWRPVSMVLLPRQEPMRYDPEEMLALARAAEKKETRKETAPPTDDHQRIA